MPDYLACFSSVPHLAGKCKSETVADSRSEKYACDMSNSTNWRTALLQRHHWVTFLLPFLVFMLVGSLEPTPEKPGGQSIGLAIPYAYYPWVYAAKIALTLAAVVLVWPGYRKFPFRLTPLAIVVGVVGGVLWIGLCLLDWEHLYLLPLLNRVGLGWLIGAGTDRRSIRSSSLPAIRSGRGPSWPCGFSAWWPSCR